MNLTDFMQNHILLLDGGTGTMLQRAGLKSGEATELWNLSHPQEIITLHRAYFDAGSNMVATNTFGANAIKYASDELEKIISSAVSHAQAAKQLSSGSQEKFIALDIGPLGKLLSPIGDLDFEEAVDDFAQAIRIGVGCGVDTILIETMNDAYETKAALLAAKENSSLPVFVSNAYQEDGRLFSGAGPEAMIAMLEGMGASAIGVNCSFGPDTLKKVATRYLEHASVPVLFKPNAGLPRMENGQTLYDLSPEEFASHVKDMIQQGVRLVGGCCGTTPEHIHLLRKAIDESTILPLREKQETVISSMTHAVYFGKEPVLIGERINPTGKKKFKAALRAHDLSYILQEGIRQEEAGAHVLDVNVGLADIDETQMLPEVVDGLMGVTNLPLQMDTTNPVAMEKALRRYCGKAMINSVNGSYAVMDAVFPLVKKYGGVVVALTLDEQGIPTTPEGRAAIAGRILEKAASYGIKSKDLIFDPLTLTLGAEDQAARITFSTMDLLKERYQAKTVLGVSNISFGMPDREMINSMFFLGALEHGLSAAIMNPDAKMMMRMYYGYRMMHGMDTSCLDFMEFETENPCNSVTAGTANNTALVTEKIAESSGTAGHPTESLQRDVVKGLKEKAANDTIDLLKQYESLQIINEALIPALDEVGKQYEKGKLFLPQLLMSANAASAAFNELKKQSNPSDQQQKRLCVVIGTVRGDIHDIGKNIVRMLLENYGFEVIDLGKDVPVSSFVEAVKEHHASIAGLSALMTTTVPAMEETIQALRKETPWCRIIVGGAVLTRELSEKIGADAYAADAMTTVRIAEKYEKD